MAVTSEKEKPSWAARVMVVVLVVGLVVAATLPGCLAKRSPVQPSTSSSKPSAPPPKEKVVVSGGLNVPAFSDVSTPTAHWYPDQPQLQFDKNMTTAEKFCEQHEARPLSIDHDVIMAVRYGLELMVIDGYHASLVRAKGARLIKYYYWAKFKYDKHTAEELKRLAKLTKCKYRRPRYWDE